MPDETSDDLLPLDERIRLVELVDRVLDRGVVLRGDVIISVAGIDLVYLELRLLLAAMETLDRARGTEGD
jgi:gas vesicle structural protein